MYNFIKNQIFIMSIQNNRLSSLPPELRAHVYQNLSFKDLKRNRDKEAVNLVLSDWYRELKATPGDSFLKRIVTQIDLLPASDSVKMRRVLERAVSTLRDFRDALRFEQWQAHQINRDKDLRTISFTEIDRRGELIAEQQAHNLIDCANRELARHTPISLFLESIPHLPIREKATALRHWLKQNGTFLVTGLGEEGFEDFHSPPPFELYPIFLKLVPNERKEVLFNVALFELQRRWDSRLFRFVMEHEQTLKTESASRLLRAAIRHYEERAMKTILKHPSFSIEHFISSGYSVTPLLCHYTKRCCPITYETILQSLSKHCRFSHDIDQLSHEQLRVLSCIELEHENMWQILFLLYYFSNKIHSVPQYYESLEEISVLLQNSIGKKLKNQKVHKTEKEKIRSFIYNMPSDLASEETIFEFIQRHEEYFHNAPFPIYIPPKLPTPQPNCTTRLTRKALTLYNSAKNLAHRLCGKKQSGRVTIRWEEPVEILSRPLSLADLNFGFNGPLQNPPHFPAQIQEIQADLHDLAQAAQEV
jgi:hypothetical protein